MKIAITDANIFIDLHYLKITHHLFFLGYEVYTTHHVINELGDELQILEPFIASGKLQIESLIPEDYLVLPQLRNSNRLSESDLSVMVVARRMGAIVLSGDDLLRKTCHLHKIEIHGILWCLDGFVKSNCIQPEEACQLLHDLMRFNERLPVHHCKEYIETKWGGSYNGN